MIVLAPDLVIGVEPLGCVTSRLEIGSLPVLNCIVGEAAQG